MIQRDSTTVAETAAKFTRWSALLPTRQNLIPLLIGFFVAPFFIVLHEGGHFFVAKILHIPAELHYSATTVHYSRLPPPPKDRWVTAGGPLVQVLAGGAGLLWLYRRRQDRRSEPANPADWLATWTALNGGRWVAGFVPAVLAPTRLGDEVLLIEAIGLPRWLGLILIGLFGCALLVATIRLHPRGARLVPFTYAFVGGFAALNLWLHWLGPRILP